MMETRLIRARYQLQSVLGERDSSITYLAWDKQEDRTCVVKEVSLEKVREWKTIELLEREAKALALFEHPGIPKFIDHFTVEDDTSIRIYLVQEYIEGQNLEHILTQQERFSEERIVDIGLQLTKILGYIHGFSPAFIHRDIKPSNILLDPTGSVYLVDFGAVRDKLLQDRKASGGGSTIVGTYGYMPFEQFSGRALPASDIYSLGMTLIHLVSGKDPSLMPKKRMRIDFRKQANISRALGLVLARMVEPKWQHRYQSARELSRDLERIQEGQGPGTAIRLTVTILAMTFLVSWAMTIVLTGTIPMVKYYFERMVKAVVAMRDEIYRESVSDEIYQKFRCLELKELKDKNPSPLTHLLVNPGLEGPCGWIFDNGVLPRNIQSENPISGEYYFALEKGDRVSQRSHLPTWSSDHYPKIRSGEYAITFSATMRASKEGIRGSPYLYGTVFRREPGSLRLRLEKIADLEGFPPVQSTEWTHVTKSWALPADADYVSVYLGRYNKEGEDRDMIAYFEDVAFRIQPKNRVKLD